jgi:hypothetical protein
LRREGRARAVYEAVLRVPKTGTGIRKKAGGHHRGAIGLYSTKTFANRTGYREIAVVFVEDGFTLF